MQGDAAGVAVSLENHQAPALIRAVVGAGTFFAVVQIAVANAEDSGGAGQNESHFVAGIGHAHAVFKTKSQASCPFVRPTARSVPGA